MDPNKVPIPASAQRGSEPSFRERLDTVAQQRAQELVPEPEAPVRQVNETVAENDAEPTTVAGETRDRPV